MSQEDLDKLVVVDAKAGTSSGVSGEVWTFVLSDGIVSVVIGGGSPEGNKVLRSDTRYYVRVLDYEAATGRKSSLSIDLGGTTSSASSDAIFGSSGSALYVYPNPTSGVLHLPVSSGIATIYGTEGSKIGSFEVSAGQVDLRPLPAGAYTLHILEHVLRVVKQ